MTTIHEVISLAGRLTRDAARDGVHVSGVSLGVGSSGIAWVGIYAADRALTPALAATLGLTDRTTNESDDGTWTEHFEGRIDGIEVHAVGPLPLAVVIDTDTGETLTAPMASEDAAVTVAHTTGRNVHVAAVTR